MFADMLVPCRGAIATKGPPEAICNALVSHCPRADFVPYARVLESRSMRQRRLIRMTPIVRALSEIQWNLYFSKSTMEKATKRLCECADWPVQIPTEERHMFVATKAT